MASTKISDIIQPAVFNTYVIERTKALSALFQSGIVTTDPRLDALAKGGSYSITMPYFKDLTGTDDVLSDSSPLVPTNITTGSQVSIKLCRGKAWGVHDLAKYLAADDPMAAIGNLVAEWWNRMMQASLIAQLTGIMLDNVANDSMDMTRNICIGAPSGANAPYSGTTDLIANVVPATHHFTGATFVVACYLLGDAAEQVTAIAVHSAVMAGMVAKDLIVYAPNSEGKMTIPMFMGKRVIVSDQCPTFATTPGTTAMRYTSFIFTNGAVAYGDGGAPVPVETDRDKLLGEDYLINRKHYILHPQGYKWVGSTTASPTNTALALAASWDRAFEKKNTGVISFVTNG